MNPCNMGGDEPRSWLMQFLQWQDIHGGWLGVIVVCWLGLWVTVLAVTSALAWEKADE